VSYSLTRSWDGGFLGNFTITNHGSQPLAHWIVTAVLPGDRVESGWGADYQDDGDTLTLTPASYDPVLAPGESQQAYFAAAGTTTRPASYRASGG
jgi:cellulase/cellobiase CelA1